MAKATTFNVSGNREDLSDMISMIEPKTYPLSSVLGNGRRPNARYSEWQVDNLEEPTWEGVTEGEDVTEFSNASEERARIGTYIQKERKSWAVSDIQEMVDTAGVASEVAYSKAKKLEALKRTIEAVIGSDQDHSSAAKSLTRGLGDWIDSAGPSEVPAAYRTPAASINTTTTTTLTEAQINTVLQSVYENCGTKKNLTLFAGPALKSKFAEYTRAEGTTTAKAYQVHQSAESKKITFDVTMYDGPLGMFSIVPSLFLGRTSGAALTDVARGRGYLLDTSLASIGYMKKPGGVELPNAGGGRKGYVDAIFQVICKNPLGLGKFAPSALS